MKVVKLIKAIPYVLAASLLLWTGTSIAAQNTTSQNQTVMPADHSSHAPAHPTTHSTHPHNTNSSY